MVIPRPGGFSSENYCAPRLPPPLTITFWFDCVRLALTGPKFPASVPDLVHRVPNPPFLILPF
jgi:hypothetical protein